MGCVPALWVGCVPALCAYSVRGQINSVRRQNSETGSVSEQNHSVRRQTLSGGIPSMDGMIPSVEPTDGRTGGGRNIQSPPLYSALAGAVTVRTPAGSGIEVICIIDSQFLVSRL